MKELLILFIILLTINAIALANKLPRQTKGNKPESNSQKEEPLPSQEIASPSNITNYSDKYQARYLLTKNEWHNFKKLKAIADVKGYLVFPKVRLLDIIEPRRGIEHYKTLLYKIQAKHVDFIICDQNVHIKAVIELDDNSHYKENRKERDQFVEQVLKSVGYKVIRTKYITDDILDLI